jgi:hypothetical protein
MVFPIQPSVHDAPRLSSRVEQAPRFARRAALERRIVDCLLRRLKPWNFPVASPIEGQLALTNRRRLANFRQGGSPDDAFQFEQAARFHQLRDLGEPNPPEEPRWLSFVMEFLRPGVKGRKYEV